MKNESKGIFSKSLFISYSSLKRAALIFVTLPLFVFFIGWLKWYWAVFACLGTLFCLMVSDERSRLSRLLKKDRSDKSAGAFSIGDEEKVLEIPVWLLAVIVLFTCGYLIICGMGRLWMQTTDYSWRNAIFRDIIVYDWPVTYQKFHGALCYYIGAWLPAAVIAKPVYLLTGNSDAAFTVGNIAMLIYFTIGLSMLFLLLLLYFQKSNFKSVIIVLIGFALFSGMDIVGNGFQLFYDDRWWVNEWWALTYQYSSFATCLSWVFNQTLIPWICTALLLHEKKVSNFVLIGMACLFSGPFPFIGYFVYCLAIGIKRCIDMIKAKQGKLFFKEVASLSNIGSILFVFPIVGSYLTSNTMMSGQDTDSKAFIALEWGPGEWGIYLFFLLLEFGVFALLIMKSNKRNFLFYISILQLMAYPLFNVGINSDLTMRSSIPSIFMMYVFVYKFILEERVLAPRVTEEEKQKQRAGSINIRINICYLLLVICLVAGALGPCCEFYYGAKATSRYGINDQKTDYIKTLDQDHNPADIEDTEPWIPTSFVSVNYEDSLFFKNFARLKES